MPNPANAPGGEVEIRPILEMDDFGEEFTPELREKEKMLRSQSEARNKPKE
jgi:hypothetical protein